MDTKWAFLISTVIDVLILFIVGLAVLLINLFAEPFHRGFYCNDETIRFPNHSSIVSNVALGLEVLFLPILVIAVFEFSRKGGWTSGVGRPFPNGVLSWLKLSGFYLFGVGLCQLIVDTGKFLSGRLRPHFLAVCLPDVTCNNTDQYVGEYTCLGADAEAIVEARKSFPSGHAASSFYAAVFLIMYLQCVFTWKGSKLLLHSIQFFFLIGAWFTAVSRVTDNHHHWSDVLSGIVIGTLAAFLNVMYISGLRLYFNLATKPKLQDAELLM